MISISRRSPRLYSTRSKAGPLTLSKFDFQAKPHNFTTITCSFYGGPDCFRRTQICPTAGRLYDAFLTMRRARLKRTEPKPTGKIDRVCQSRLNAARRRALQGLNANAAFTNEGWENVFTAAAPIFVLSGLRRTVREFSEPLLKLKSHTPAAGSTPSFCQYRTAVQFFADGRCEINGALAIAPNPQL